MTSSRDLGFECLFSDVPAGIYSSSSRGYTLDISRCVVRLRIPLAHSTGDPMETGSVFKSNRSQAIRMPKAVALPDDVTRVDIVAIGRTRIITPAGESWDSWFDEDDRVSADFMNERDQPAEQVREEF